MIKAVVTPARPYAVSRLALSGWIFLDLSGSGAKRLAPPRDRR